jgi:hypothetical protein
VITKAEAEVLRAKWKQQIDPPDCAHLIQELEQDEIGYLTGMYICNLCGESLAKSHLAA